MILKMRDMKLLFFSKYWVRRALGPIFRNSFPTSEEEDRWRKDGLKLGRDKMALVRTDSVGEPLVEFFAVLDINAILDELYSDGRSVESLEPVVPPQIVKVDHIDISLRFLKYTDLFCGTYVMKVKRTW